MPVLIRQLEKLTVVLLDWKERSVHLLAREPTTSNLVDGTLSTFGRRELDVHKALQSFTDTGTRAYAL